MTWGANHWTDSSDSSSCLPVLDPLFLLLLKPWALPILETFKSLRSWLKFNDDRTNQHLFIVLNVISTDTSCYSCYSWSENNPFFLKKNPLNSAFSYDILIKQKPFEGVWFFFYFCQKSLILVLGTT